MCENNSSDHSRISTPNWVVSSPELWWCTLSFISVYYHLSPPAVSLSSFLALPWTCEGIEIRQQPEKILVRANMSAHAHLFFFFLFVPLSACVSNGVTSSWHSQHLDCYSMCVHWECVNEARRSESVLGSQPFLQIKNKRDLSHMRTLYIYTFRAFQDIPRSHSSTLSFPPSFPPFKNTHS